MNFGRLKVGSIVGAVLVHVLGLLLSMPGAALAGEPFATVKAWEVQEFLRLLTGDDDGDSNRRNARATLVGQATGGLCLPTGQDPCAIDGHARSSVDLSTGQGPISGTFNILFDMDPVSPLLMDLVKVAEVELRGSLDLRPALFGGVPVAFAAGDWKSKNFSRGTFTATFLIPVPDFLVPGKAGACGATVFAYFNPLASPPVFECLGAGDFSLGGPVVKVTADLTKRARGGRGEHRDDD